MKRFIVLMVPLVAQLFLVGITGIQAQDRTQPARSIMTVFFEDVNEPQSRICLGISHKADSKTITRYSEKKSQKGTYSRTQSNVLICEAGPCEQQWSSSFIHTDETGKSDSFILTWKQTVFEGITPTGTSKRELLYCVNGVCTTLEDTANAEGRCIEMTKDYHCRSYESAPDFDAPKAATIGRYQITWRKPSLVIMMK